MHTMRAWLFPVALGCLCAIAPCTLAAEAASLVELLRSVDWAARAKGYEIAAARPTLTPEEIRALVGCLQYPEQPVTKPPYSPYGPETTETRLTRILIAHGDQAHSFLLEALSDPDWNTRRYAAFCLGAICKKEAIPGLRRALNEEVQHASRSTVSVGDGAKAPFLSVVGAMIDTYARLNPAEAVEWSLALFVSNDHDFRNLVANYALARIAREPPMGYQDEVAWWSAILKDKWMAWWRENRGRCHGAGFRIEACGADPHGGRPPGTGPLASLSGAPCP